MVTAIE